ncbi:MAG: galactose-1-phosphate uridylyltransferase [Acidobacteriota bacterium]|jgi:UDPglucose--hexose-1-phosphate uridylyltransferase|nr:galactose-1-phosphate uridylyltransferase [Acidobacteriota bacterium]
MPELRQDPLSGDWVIFAPERGTRPDHLDRPRPEETDPDICPFCPGHEHLTPPAILAWKKDGHASSGSDWAVRVFANLYPALRVEGEVAARPDGFYDCMNGIGAHEIVVLTPDHRARPSGLSAGHWRLVLDACQSRIRDLRGDIRLRHIQLFLNHGYRGGATQPHAHAQLLALPLVPPRVQQRAQRMQDHFSRRGRCLLCDIRAVELDEKERVFMDSGRVTGFVPYAAVHPFTMWLVPATHLARFEDADAASLDAMAAALQESLAGMDRLLERPDFQVVIHSAPFHEDGAAWRHWFIEILPVLSGTGGFEHATGCRINTVLPEEAATALAGV